MLCDPRGIRMLTSPRILIDIESTAIGAETAIDARRAGGGSSECLTSILAARSKGQIDLHRRPLTGSAFNGQSTAVYFGHPLRNNQSQT